MAIVKRLQLVSALTDAAAVATGKDGAMRLRFMPGVIELTATDLITELTQTVEAKESLVEDECMANAKRLLDIAKAFSDADVDLDLESESSLSLVCGASTMQLAVTNADSYPCSTAGRPTTLHRLETDEVSSLIGQVKYAVGKDETRINLTGVFFKWLDDAIELCATDGHRLASAKLGAVGSCGEAGVIIPARGVDQLRRFMAGETEINLGWAGSMMVASKGGSTLAIRLYDDKYPDYKQVIPAIIEDAPSVDREALVEALKRTLPLTAELSRLVRLTFDNDWVEITHQTVDVGSSREDMPCNCLKACAFAVNVKYLLDALNSCQSERVELSQSDPLAPILVRGLKNSSVVHVIMPMRG